jgi:hypothetical protein
MKSALYALQYVHSTHDMGIYFSSRRRQPLHSYLHHPDASDAEAYDDALPPPPHRLGRLTTYSDACWGSQLGNSVSPGTSIPLFKFRSMSGAVVFRMSGPVAWLGVRQDQTALSSCEAEIRAANEGSKLTTVELLNLARDFERTGITLPDTSSPVAVYNNNESAVNWSRNLTTKGVRHMELRENSVREWVLEGTLKVLHVSGRCNPSDIFTKEMKDGAHYRHLRDSFMCPASTFLRTSLADILRRIHGMG